MITVAPATAQINEIRNEYGVTAHGDTYAIDYGRTNGLVVDEMEILADAVEARRHMAKVSKARPNSREWMKAASRSDELARQYAAATGMSMRETYAKIQGICACFSK